MTERAADFWRVTAAWAFRHLATLAIVLAFLSSVAQPWAETFIRKTVAQDKYATQRSLEGIENRTGNLERRLERMEQELNAQGRVQAKTERDLDYLKALQTEQRSDTKRILERLGIPPD